MKVAAVWPPLRDLFAVDDGTLPEIRVTCLSRQAIQAAYSLVRSVGSVDPDASFCRMNSERGEKIIGVPDAAQLVANGRAHPFHFLMRHIVIGDTELPEIGVFVFPDQLALDYRMGPSWGDPEIAALFELVRRIWILDPSSRVTLEEGVLPEVQETFRTAWERYLDGKV